MPLSPGHGAKLCWCSGLCTLEQAQDTVLHLVKVFGGQSALLCHPGSCPLHLGQTTLNSPCLQYPMSTVRARQLELPRAATWKLQTDEMGKHLGISCVTSCWLISQCLLKGSTFRKAEHVCCWSEGAAGCRNSEQNQKSKFWCNLVSRTENLSHAYHVVVKKHPKEWNICLSCNCLINCAYSANFSRKLIQKYFRKYFHDFSCQLGLGRALISHSHPCVDAAALKPAHTKLDHKPGKLSYPKQTSSTW